MKEAALRSADDPFAEHRETPLAEHLTAWETALHAIGANERHIELTLARARAIAEHRKLKVWDDVTPEAVQAFAVELRRRDERGKGRFGVRTRNGYVGALKQFTKWMYETKRAADDPLRLLKRERGQRADERHPRRAFTDAELTALVAVAESDPGKVCGIRGPDRAKLYQFAAATGFRRGEIESLTWASLTLGDDPTATVSAAYAKNGEGRTVPLTARVAAILGGWRTQRASEGSEHKVFPMPHRTDAARMVRRDLERTGLDYVNDAGEFGDFHSFRHTYATRLVRKGVPVATAMRLLGHKTIAMTMEVYSHVLMPDQRSAVESAVGDLFADASGSRLPKSA
jgi:integrase